MIFEEFDIENSDGFDQEQDKEESENLFVIDNDEKAEWAIEKLKDLKDEYERILALANAKMDELQAKITREQEKYEKDKQFFEILLTKYLESVKCKTTKSGTKSTFTELEPDISTT